MRSTGRFAQGLEHDLDGGEIAGRAKRSAPVRIDDSSRTGSGGIKVARDKRVTGSIVLLSSIAQHMAGMFRVEIIVNPKAGGPSVRKAEDLMDILRGQGIYVRLRGTRFRGHAEALAHEAAAQTVDRLVVAGGDGTINEVINGLAGAPIPLVIIPCGTANVLANELVRGVECGDSSDLGGSRSKRERREIGPMHGGVQSRCLYHDRRRGSWRSGAGGRPSPG